MIAKVEMVQIWPIEGVARIRINYYREPGEAGYEEHYVQVPDMRGQVYSGKVGDLGNPDEQEYTDWVNSLPKVWQNNPCLNQIIQISLGTTMAQVRAFASAHIKRLKANYPKVITPAIQEQVKNQLCELGVGKERVKPISVSGRDAIATNHPLLNIEVKG